MQKSLTAILAAAAIAAAMTIFAGPTEMVTAGPLPAATVAPMQACAERPWPYLRCVGTPFGNPRIRLVTSEQISD